MESLRFRRAVFVLARLLLSTAACAGHPTVPETPAFAPRMAGPPPGETPSAALSSFVDAVEGGRWAQAAALLSARWRARYTPERLEADYQGAGPLAREATARVQAALKAGTPLAVEDGRAELPVLGGRALLVAEAGGWRVDALE